MKNEISKVIANTAFQTYEKRLQKEVLESPIPHHVAIIMDGNRRFAREFGLQPHEGHVKGKDKLLSLRIDVGEPTPRPLVAGIALHYAPEDLVGKRIVVVANLAPRKFGKDLVSHGMLLAAKSGDRLTLVTTFDDIPAGSKLS